MGYIGSYIWKLRKKIGHDLLLIPASGAIIEREDKAILLMKRQDNGLWSTIGGLAEPGMSHKDVVLQEIKEEAGFEVQGGELIPFASFSDPSVFTITYPSGDVVQGYALLFILRGAPLPQTLKTQDASEVAELRFFHLDEIPYDQMTPATQREIMLYKKYLETSEFQLS